MDKKHSVVILTNAISITGVENVISLFDKEVELNTVNGVVTVTGSGLTATKLAVDEGTINISAEKIDSVKYGGKKKFNLGKLFK